jgi:fibronectin-binding autotransporter adhesin
MRQLLAGFASQPSAVGAAVALIAALAIGWSAAPALAATPVCTWTGGSADWNTATDWSCANTGDTIPTSSDDVIIGDFGNPDVTSVDANARSITESAAGTLNIETGRTLTISSSGSSSLAGHINVNGTGVLTLGDPTTWSQADLATVTDSGTLNVNSSLSVTGTGAVQGGGLVKVGTNGSITTDPGSAKTVTFVPKLDDDGTCNGCAVTVSSGTLELQNGDAGTTTGNYSVAGGATLQVDNGTFDAPSVTGSGTVFLAGTSHLTVGSSDTFTPAGLTINGGGGPTATLNKDVSVATFTTGGFGSRDGTGTLTVTGTADFTGNFTLDGGTTTIADTVASSTIATGVVLNGATLNLDAPTNRTTDGGLQLGGNPSTLNINSSFDVTGANAPITGNSSSLVNIGPTGALTADPGSNHETDIFVPVNNEGTVTTKTGTLALFDGITGTNSGGYVIAANGILELEGTAPFNSPSVTGAGTFWDEGPTATVGSTDTFSPADVKLGNGGTLTLNRAASIVNLLDSGGGTRNGTGTLTITGSITIPAAGGVTFSGGTTTVASSASPVSLETGGGVNLSGATLNLDVPTTWTTSPIGLGSASTLNINSTFLDSGTQTMGFGSDSVLHVESTGSLTVDPGSGKSFTTETQIQNEGTIAIASGTTTSAGLTQSNGTTTVASGAELDGPVTLAGGTLKGNGTLGGPVSNTGGTVAPGSSPGTLTINGAYTQGPGGTLAEQITGTTPGTQFDRLLVAGPLSLGGTLAIDSTSFTPASTDTFKIVSGASSRSGTFAALTGTTVNGATYSAQYDTDGMTLLVSGPPPPPDQTLSVTFAGAGAGSVSDGASLSCSAGCQHKYPQGTVVHLTATPASGSTFAGWAGGGCSGTGTCTVTLNGDTSVTANFTANQPPPPPTQCVVPKLKGKKLGAAKNAIRKAHCSVGKVTKVKSKKRHKNRVISQNPKPGAHLKKGSKVALKVGT